MTPASALAEAARPPAWPPHRCNRASSPYSSGSHLHDLRERAGISVRELARQLDIHHTNTRLAPGFAQGVRRDQIPFLVAGRAATAARRRCRLPRGVCPLVSIGCHSPAESGNKWTRRPSSRLREDACITFWEVPAPPFRPSAKPLPNGFCERKTDGGFFRRRARRQAIPQERPSCTSEERARKRRE